MSTIDCNIVSAQQELFSGKATMVIATGEEGELGITPRHTPLITRLKPGQVRVIQEEGDEEFLYISGGILEVQPHLVTILADTAIRAHDLDEAAALKAKEEAERALADHEADIDYAEAQAQLTQAVAQLAALERLRKTVKR
ncbi:MAG: F0F1 ATP synthase subunit epsilon [Xanthomonadales bacterium]|nr:F0F1 ATP synthase subunit epsilon [Xanthomonadales bacterium]